MFEKRLKGGKIAKEIGISAGTFSAIINDKQLPSFDIAYKLCMYFGKGINELWIKEE